MILAWASTFNITTIYESLCPPITNKHIFLSSEKIYRVTGVKKIKMKTNMEVECRNICLGTHTAQYSSKVRIWTLKSDETIPAVRQLFKNIDH